MSDAWADELSYILDYYLSQENIIAPDYSLLT